MVTESTYGLAWEDGFTLDMRRFLSLCDLEMLFFFYFQLLMVVALNLKQYPVTVRYQ